MQFKNFVFFDSYVLTNTIITLDLPPLNDENTSKVSTKDSDSSDGEEIPEADTSGEIDVQKSRVKVKPSTNVRIHIIRF